MFYTELDPNIDYSRPNLRWNGWGEKGRDFFKKDYVPEIVKLLSNEWNLSNPPKKISDQDQKPDAIKIPSSKLNKSQIASLTKLFGKNNVKTDPLERIIHSAGKSYFDVLRLKCNQLKSFVDGVVYPLTEKEIAALLDYCNRQKIAIIPFGGGSSVVGALEALKGKNKVLISLDTTRMNRILHIDEVSMTADVEAGIYGPIIEKSLNDKGFTLGHFPQSFEYSTLGGWIAARSSGQQSSYYGKIEKILESATILTPAGKIETLKNPASSTGPEVKEIIAGSEGILGVITKAIVKIKKLPESRKYFGVLFQDFHSGSNFIRTLCQRKITFSMARLSDQEETRLFMMLADLGKKAGPIHSIQKWITAQVLQKYGMANEKCLLICGVDGEESVILQTTKEIKKVISEYHGFYIGEKPGRNWLHSRYNMPFLRNHLMEYGIGVDTLETSITWDRVETLHDTVLLEIRKNIPDCNAMCHISHSYPDGACLYFTIIFPMSEDPIRQWHKLKDSASEAILKVGGSISHHHGVGLDHKKFFVKQNSKTYIELLKSIKKGLDPKDIMSPEKLF